MQRSRTNRPVRARSVRGARTNRAQGGFGNHRARAVVGRILLVIALVAAGVKLIEVQVINAAELSAASRKQRTTSLDLPGSRGSITDRNGKLLAFSSQSAALYALPQRITQLWDADHERAKTSGGKPVPNGEERKKAIAAKMKQVLGDQIDENEVLKKLQSDAKYVVLATGVEPGKARDINKAVNDVGVERREERQYPGGALASDIIGFANWRLEEKPNRLGGLMGLEGMRNNVLTGKNGQRVVDTWANNDEAVIPGSERELVPPTPGSDLELTIDADVQYRLQEMLVDYAQRAKARSASAVVLDVKTGEVVAIADDKPFDLNNFKDSTPAQHNLQAVTSPFEPGSVNKIVTAAAGIEYGLVEPTTVLNVPGTKSYPGYVVSDAWDHGVLRMSFAGVLGKSSNVGTLMVADQIGPDRYADMLNRFGLGQLTGVGLPGESRGQLPARNQWSGSTFGNLPIGQGLSMTVLQMAGMYQAIANDGKRIPPRILRAEVGPNKDRRVEKQPDAVQVVSPQTAKTVREMMRAVAQHVPGKPNLSGTGPEAALQGYQISGKTGTAQQIDPRTKRYSQDLYWITFAGILPADNPRYVVGLMLDQPQRGLPESRSAAPLFHDIASYLVQKYQIPVSNPTESPIQELIVP
ncbi:cell division protein FtsI (penicillin-binding protein 3) [Crossiella equi]|uniref:Cell division protein FtsI (Penicillin-binding protein 3) n=2 Tax=Crossiella equi TaxID=130796 RepID=A0ABS5AKZ9_9PSEU|nr:penicillin-binding protein 2 [Crossiella equi]MBP2477241.1 cell division protein FtsI (penicillin-binding protein 3) [Crossiella equi]